MFQSVLKIASFKETYRFQCPFFQGQQNCSFMLSKQTQNPKIILENRCFIALGDDRFQGFFCVTIFSKLKCFFSHTLFHIQQFQLVLVNAAKKSTFPILKSQKVKSFFEKFESVQLRKNLCRTLEILKCFKNVITYHILNCHENVIDFTNVHYCYLYQTGQIPTTLIMKFAIPILIILRFKTYYIYELKED